MPRDFPVKLSAPAREIDPSAGFLLESTRLHMYQRCGSDWYLLVSMRSRRIALARFQSGFPVHC